MYTESPEDYLQTRGLQIKPIERKNSDTFLHTKEKEHQMKIKKDLEYQR